MSVFVPFAVKCDAAMTQLGWIDYLNLLPMLHELRAAYGDELTMTSGHPTHVNALLAAGEVALAPCSSALLAFSPSVEVAVPIGIASFGTVRSVYLGLAQPNPALETAIERRQSRLRQWFMTREGFSPCEAPALAAGVTTHADTTFADDALEQGSPPVLSLTPASAASATLARIFCRLWFGAPAPEAGLADASTHTEHPRLELLIGDVALQERSRFSRIFDLGEMWREATGLPFVFAVWQKNRASKADGRLQDAVMYAAARADLFMKLHPTKYLPSPVPCDTQGMPFDLAEYWGGLSYVLGRHHLAGLALYLSLIEHLGLGKSPVAHTLERLQLASVTRVDQEQAAHHPLG